MHTDLKKALVQKNICLSRRRRRREAKSAPQALRKSAAGTLRSAAGEIFENMALKIDFFKKMYLLKKIALAKIALANRFDPPPKWRKISKKSTCTLAKTRGGSLVGGILQEILL